jgi:hypothetical protein
MRRKPWMSVIFLVMIAALLITWAETHSRLRRGVLDDTPPKPVKKDTSFVLTGKLGLTHRTSGWLCGSRSGLLRRAAWLDRTGAFRCMGCPAGAADEPADGPVAARALAPSARRSSDQR